MLRSSVLPKASSQLLSHPWCCQACGHFPQPPDHEDPSELSCGTQDLQATGISGFGFQLEELLKGRKRARGSVVEMELMQVWEFSFRKPTAALAERQSLELISFGKNGT